MQNTIIPKNGGTSTLLESTIVSLFRDRWKLWPTHLHHPVLKWLHPHKEKDKMHLPRETGDAQETII